LNIVIVLIGETAHQAPTDAGNFGGIEREALFFGHLDRNDAKVSDP
jgi:hypothetical protein